MSSSERVTGFPGVPTIFAILAGDEDASRSTIFRASATSRTPPRRCRVKHIVMLQRALPEGAHLLDVRPHRVQALHVPAAGGPRSKADERRDRHPEHRAVDRRRGRQARGPGRGRPARHSRRDGDAGLLGKAGGDGQEARPGPLPGEQVLYTGDYCRLDEEGYLYFVGRMDEIIKSRGEKVAPKEVENALMDIPGVREAAVIGVPDEILGQAVKAFVVLEEGRTLDEKQLQNECQRRLENFMVPKSIVIVPSLPRTDTAKLNKRALSQFTE